MSSGCLCCTTEIHLVDVYPLDRPAGRVHRTNLAATVIRVSQMYPRRGVWWILTATCWTARLQMSNDGSPGDRTVTTRVRQRAEELDVDHDGFVLGEGAGGAASRPVRG